MALVPLDGGAIKKSRASLIGGIAVGLGAMALWWALARDLGRDGTASMVLGAAVSAAIALWIWKADL